MIPKSLAKPALLVALFSGFSGWADTSPAPTPAPAVSSAQSTPAIDLKLTGPEMSMHGTTLRKQADEDFQYVQKLAARARKLNDIIKLSCVNNKLVELKAEMNILDTAYTQFTSQVAFGADEARPSYRRVNELGIEVHSLRSDADACAGVPELTKQDSGNTVSHPDFPDDPTVPPPVDWNIEPPGYASPFN
jgi:hypothetical protein